MSSSSSNQVPSAWPPPSIATHTDAILLQCESMEMLLNGIHDDLLLPLVQIACFLYKGQCHHAHHVFARYQHVLQDNPTMQQWHRVAVAMTHMTNLEELWNSLKACQGADEPLRTYAKQVEAGLRERYEFPQISAANLPPLVKSKTRNQKDKASSTTTHIVSFLETTRWNM